MKDCKQNVLDLTGPHVYADSIKKIINIKDLWSKEDDEINNTDYKDYATFKTEAAKLLYLERPHWKYGFRTKNNIILKLILLLTVVLILYYLFKFSINK